jgi:hypothetical protein
MFCLIRSFTCSEANLRAAKRHKLSVKAADSSVAV